MIYSKPNIRSISTLISFALFFIVSITTSNARTLRSDIITSDQLGGKERYLLYVSTDKPIYRENETVYIRAILLNSLDNSPLKTHSANLSMQIQGPKGDVVFNGYTQALNSSGGLVWKVPTGSPGGQYTVKVQSPNLGVSEGERVFEIRAYRAPRLTTQIEFTRDGYGPGDTIQSTIKIQRAEGGIPRNAKINAIARIDGKEIYSKKGLNISALGVCSTEFRLPSTILKGDGSISFIIEDGGVIETANKTLPILLQNLNIAFYPEGGDLISGLYNRVYVQALRPNGKPADIEGFLISNKSGKIQQHPDIKLKTLHEGRGLISFKAERGTKYSLALTSPSGIAKNFPLPEPKIQGATLSSLKPTYPFDETISLSVQTTLSETHTITLHKREILLDSKNLTESKLKAQTFQLDPKDSEGVLIATLWNHKGAPLAERLIYREPKFLLNINIEASKESYAPGDTVSLDITTSDENGQPVEAVVGLTVSDESVLEMIETREQAPRLPVMVYLESEVKDLADAVIYLDPDNPDSEKSIDLLLGTQGWRRFILVDYPDIDKQYPDHAKRVLAQISHLIPQHARSVLGVGIKKKNKPMENQPLAPMALPLKQEMNEQEELIAVEDILMEKNVRDEDRIANFAKEAKMAARHKPTAHTYIREYAHTVRPNRKANERTDFTETLYWNAGIKTGARDGKAKVSFSLSDSITRFRILADGFGRNGALGSNDGIIQSLEPFYIEPKMPLSATVGDIIELPVAFINETEQDIKTARLLVQGEGLSIRQAKPQNLKAKQRSRQMVQIRTDRPGEFSLLFKGSAGIYSDNVERKLVVHPKGFPVSITKGGLLSQEKHFETHITIPNQVELSSLRASAKIYPSPLASMEEALSALLREPYGCFEQTSSSTYPLVMAQQYFLSHQGVDPEKILRTKNLLKKGYDRLIGFESPNKGYEWFGASPAHEALTAYGLMEFVDLSKVMQVDEAMIVRTRNWLLKRRDGSGGFKRDSKALDSFGRAPAPTTNAYIIWALLESGEPATTLQTEISAIKKLAMNTKDTYIIALTSNILYLAGDKEGARTLAIKLSDNITPNGLVPNAETSITQSGGDALNIETTSLSILAWLKEDKRWAAQVETSIKWLFERSKSGRFGSTQSTVLALKAINSYDSARSKPKKNGSVQLMIDGNKYGKPVAFTEHTKGAIELPDFAAKLTAGSHKLQLIMENGSEMPFAMEIKFNTALPHGSSQSIQLNTAISDTEVNEGESLDMHLQLEVGQKAAPTPIAIIGIPAGLEVRHEQLKELVTANRISAYEVVGQDLRLYWRALKAKQKVYIPLALTANIPGEYTGPASRAYLYYTDEEKSWVQGLSIKINKR